jgi:hypothetical protein
VFPRPDVVSVSEIMRCRATPDSGVIPVNSKGIGGKVGYAGQVAPKTVADYRGFLCNDGTVIVRKLPLVAP